VCQVSVERFDIITTTVFLWQQILGEVEGEQLVHRVSPLHYIHLITRRELYLTCGMVAILSWSTYMEIPLEQQGYFYC